uniref:Uncharacterized protein n=1 Tax=Rhizophora mucronata TaxID=61149 RepID=A0A2P2QCZ7_RHIMU
MLVSFYGFCMEVNLWHLDQ